MWLQCAWAPRLVGVAETHPCRLAPPMVLPEARTPASVASFRPQGSRRGDLLASRRSQCHISLHCIGCDCITRPSLKLLLGPRGYQTPGCLGPWAQPKLRTEAHLSQSKENEQSETNTGVLGQKEDGHRGPKPQGSAGV